MARYSDRWSEYGRRHHEERYKTSSPGGFFHVFNRGVGKQAIFREENDYRAYLAKLEAIQRNGTTEVLAYCLMPNHVHLLLRQGESEPIGSFVSSLHTSHAKRFNAKYQHVGHLFQGRFRQVSVRRDVYLRHLVAYIHLNPVEAKLVRTPREYPWSSWRAYAQGEQNPACRPRVLLEHFGGTKGYRAFEKEILAAPPAKRWIPASSALIE